MHKALKIAAVISASLWLTACGKQDDGAQAQQERPPTPVGVMIVEAKSQTIQVELPGRSKSFLEAEVRPQPW